MDSVCPGELVETKRAKEANRGEKSKNRDKSSQSKKPDQECSKHEHTYILCTC